MGKPVTVTISHELGVEGAKVRIDDRFDALADSIGGNMGLSFDREWQGDKLVFRAKGMGMKVPGEIDVFPEHIRIEAVLPTLLANMAEALQGKMESGGTKMLEDKST